jgi:hypothetical protein
MTMKQVQAFSSDQIAAMSGNQVDALFAATPIVLDLDGNGIQTTAAAQGVQFDLNATGKTQQWGWSDGKDGLLTLDRNQNGVIDDGSELFGSGVQLASGRRAADGYIAMRELDLNGDGLLDAKDAAFDDLRVWVDRNLDGLSAAAELLSLSELSIVSLDLQATKGDEMNAGNLIGLVSNYTLADGSQNTLADVWFSKQAQPDDAPPTENASTAVPSRASEEASELTLPGLNELLVACDQGLPTLPAPSQAADPRAMGGPSAHLLEASDGGERTHHWMRPRRNPGEDEDPPLPWV